MMGKKIEKIVTVQPLIKGRIDVKIKGVTPLLMEKMNMDVVEKYNKKKGKQVIKSDDKMEEELVAGKIHYDNKGNIAFPSTGFLKAITEVAPYLDGLDKKKIRGSIQLLDPMVPLDYKEQINNVTWGKTSGISKAPRKIIRPEFTEWSCTLRLEYNQANISADQIVNAIRWAGFHIGIGGWRPQCGGVYGRFDILGDKNESL